MKKISSPKRFQMEPQPRLKTTSFECPVELALTVISGKWKPSIIFNLRNRQLRHGELRKLMKRISPRMLALQLRDLERDGIIFRDVYAEIPPRVEYGLTKFGETLTPVMKVMAKWGKDMGWRKPD